MTARVGRCPEVFIKPWGLVSEHRQGYHSIVAETVKFFLESVTDANMQRFALVAILFLSISVVMVTTVQGQEALLAPPDRPSFFSTPDQLRTYLKALNEYYSIVGRPRFGRSAEKRSPASSLYDESDETHHGIAITEKLKID